MPDLSQYQNVFRIAKPNGSKRGHGSKRKQQSSGGQAVEQNGGLDNDDNVSKAQARLQKLEEMVTMLMQSNQGTGVKDDQPTPPSTCSNEHPIGVSVGSGANASSTSRETSLPTPDVPSNGHLDVSGAETRYLGATHWAAILENIKEIQDCLAPEDVTGGDGDPSTELDQPDVILSNAKPLTLADVWASLPPKPVADRLLSVQFNARYLHIPFIHKGKFLREYESFWNDASSVSFLWISILFSALHLGYRISQSQGHDTLQSRKEEGTDLFLTRAAQALMAGHYQKARPYSVEATMLYAICKFFQKQDPDTEPWLMMGVAARLALRMGYHRDPCHLAHISPFEGEMRRRTFSTVQTFELLLSFQAGLPAIIHEQACDTEPPSNLFDDDFDESCTSLPPSRPPTDPTPMLYYCYKGRIAQTFRKVARQALSPRLPAYQDVMQLDSELRQIRSEIPPSLVWKPLSASLADETYAIMHRLNLELVYQKSVMILHRRYLNYDRSNPDHGYSRKACITASLLVLQYQAEIHQAAQPGGQLHGDQFAASGIALHDFLLADMLVSLDLYESHRENATPSDADLDAQRKKYDTLQTSQQIWQSRRTMSPDAKRASNVLAVLLSKIPRLGGQMESTDNGAQDSSKDVSQPLAHMHLDTDANRDAPNSSFPAGLAQSEVLGFPSAPLDFFTSQNLPSQDFLDAVFTDSDMLNWGVLDQYIQEGATPMRSFDF